MSGCASRWATASARSGSIRSSRRGSRSEGIVIWGSSKIRTINNRQVTYDATHKQKCSPQERKAASPQDDRMCIWGLC